MVIKIVHKLNSKLASFFILLFIMSFGGIGFAQENQDIPVSVMIVKVGNVIAEVNESIPADPTDDQTKPPKGYEALYQVSPIIIAVAYKLNKGEYGTLTTFSVGDKYYIARVEHHYHPAPPDNATPEEKAKYRKPWGWHKGCTVYKLKLKSIFAVVKVLQGLKE